MAVRKKKLGTDDPLVFDIDKADAAAIHAVNRGDATPEMQRRAIDCIMKKICLIGGVVYGEHKEFMAGRRFPALAIVSIITSDVDVFDKPN